MLSGLVDDEDGVNILFQQILECIEMALHSLEVEARQNESRADAALGTDGAKDVGCGAPLTMKAKFWISPCKAGAMRNP
jgi:hypothetical protein